jgi:hypothetical protein
VCSYSTIDGNLIFSENENKSANNAYFLLLLPEIIITIMMGVGGGGTISITTRVDSKKFHAGVDDENSF